MKYIFIFLALCINAISYSISSNNIIYEVIHIEPKCDEKQVDFTFIEKIIQETSQNISLIDKNNPLEATNILLIIDTVIKKSGLTYEENIFLLKDMPSGYSSTNSTNVYRGNCIVFSLLYIIVGDELHLPLKLVLTPGHVFVRWNYPDGKYVNWDTVAGETISNDEYKQLYVCNTKSDLVACLYTLTGIYYEDNKMYNKAILEYNKAIQMAPLLTWPLNNKGSLYYDMNNYINAIDCFSDVIRIDNTCIEAYNSRALAWQKIGNYTNGLNDINTAIGIIGNYTNGLYDINTVIELDKNTAGLFLNRGNMYCSMQRYKEAIDDYLHAMDLDYDSITVYYNLAYVYELVEDFNRAAFVYFHITERFPREYEAYRKLARVYKYTGNYENALTCLNKVIELEPKNPTNYYYRGDLIKKHDWQSALIDYHKAAELDPSFVAPYLNMANIYIYTSNENAAVEVLTNCLNYSTHNYFVYFYLGSLYNYMKKYDAAKMCYDKSIQLNDTYYNAFIERGNILLEIGDIKGSLADYERAAAISNDNANVLNEIAWLYITNGKVKDIKKGLAYAQKAVKLKRSSALLDTLACAYAELGKFDESIRLEEEAYNASKEQYYKDMIQVFKQKETYSDWKNKNK